MYKALAISIADNDSNATYYDGTYVYYSKFERSPKDPSSLINDFSLLKQNINLDFDELNDLILDVGLSFVEKYFNNNSEMLEAWNNMARPGAEQYFQANNQLKEQLGVKSKNVWIISNHYVRSLTGWMFVTSPINISVVFDADDNNNSYSIFRGDNLIDTGTISLNSILKNVSDAADLLDIDTKVDGTNKFSDLQAFGKLDFKFLNILRQYDLNSQSNIFDPTLWKEFKTDPLVAHFTMMDWARNVHTHIGDLLVNFFEKYTNPDETIYYTGNIVQNKLWNKQLKLKFPHLFIPPHYKNDGNSLGGVEWIRRKNNFPKLFLESFPYCQSDVAPESTPSDTTIALAASLLANGKIIAWYQGNGEMGFESLGNRSILMSPEGSKTRLDEVLNREPFRLYNSAVLDEFARTNFVLTHQDEYRLCSSNVKESDLNLSAITHIDKSSKVQVVTKNNPVFKSLLTEFYNLTDCPVLLNESLKLPGKSLVSDPAEAMELFDAMDIDAVFIGDEYFIKSV